MASSTSVFSAILLVLVAFLVCFVENAEASAVAPGAAPDGVLASWQPSCDVTGVWECVDASRQVIGGSPNAEAMRPGQRELVYEPGDVTFRGSYDWFNPKIGETVYEEMVCAFEIWHASAADPVARCFDSLDATVFEMHFLDNCTRLVAALGEPYGTYTVVGPDAWKQMASAAAAECLRSTEVTSAPEEEDIGGASAGVIDTYTGWNPVCDVSGAYACGGRNMRYVDGAPRPEAFTNSVYNVTHAVEGDEKTFVMSYEWEYDLLDLRVAEVALCAFEVWSDAVSPSALCFDGIDGSYHELLFDCDDSCVCTMYQIVSEPFGSHGEIMQGTPESWVQSPVTGAYACPPIDGNGTEAAAAAAEAKFDSWRPTCDLSGEWKCEMRKRRGDEVGIQAVDPDRAETIVFSSEDDLTFSVSYEWVYKSPDGPELIEETEVCAFKPWSDATSPQAACADAIDATTYTLQFLCDEGCGDCRLLELFGEVFGHTDTPDGLFWSWEQGAVAGAIECTRA